MLRLNNLNSPKGATRNRKRIGRGPSSGQGTQAGKGNKGQKARAGGVVRPGFVGGGKPLYMRLPKVGFNNANFTKKYAVISLSIIDKKFAMGEEVSRATLVDKGLLKGAKRNLPVKILTGDISKSLKFVKINSFSKTALEKIQAVGGTFK
jgi:large subunit ribosomal protein L15